MLVFVVHWEDDPDRTREVRGLCRVCFPDVTYLEEREWLESQLAYLVSPTGLSHHGEDGRTDCGKDATGLDWWWRL